MGRDVHYRTPARRYWERGRVPGFCLSAPTPLTEQPLAPSLASPSRLQALQADGSCSQSQKDPIPRTSLLSGEHLRDSEHPGPP